MKLRCLAICFSAAIIVALFSDLLQRGDYLGVHDFGIEFHDQDLEPVRDRIIEVIKPDEAIGLTRWYEVVR
jgi:hypothetical protein